jgi:WD40 repeat protein
MTVTDPLTAHTSPSIPAVSTISLSFSPDGRTLASTHGDHTVKITSCHTGKLVRNLDGHPRTPWTVKYHPTDSNIVASGCLGFQVRVWDWNYRPNRVKKNGAGVGAGVGVGVGWSKVADQQEYGRNLSVTVRLQDVRCEPEKKNAPSKQGPTT